MVRVRVRLRLRPRPRVRVRVRAPARLAALLAEDDAAVGAAVVRVGAGLPGVGAGGDVSLVLDVEQVAHLVGVRVRV